MSGLFLCSALIHEIHHLIKNRYKTIKSRHEKKFQKFWTAQKKENKVSKPVLLKSIVHNFSSNNLTQEQYEALSHDLDHHIPTNINKNDIKIEFESFFQNLLYDLSDMPENEISKVKTKIRNTCEEYCHVKSSLIYLIGKIYRGESRINFRVLKNFTKKKIEHSNDVICRKIIDSARSKKVQF